jgi:hypothetical protein
MTILSETRLRRDVDTSRDRLETEASRPRPHPWQFVVNGRYLLHKVQWQAPFDVTEILQKLAEYLKKFGPHVHVVFDDNEYGPSTKDHEHSY